MPPIAQPTTARRRRPSTAFSLIELVIVVVIIAVIGAIAIPKMSRGSQGAGDAALVQDLAVLRGALDLYQAENGGAYPPAANVANCLLEYNDGTGSGTTSATKTGNFVYGPYLRSVPPLPVGSLKGSNMIADATAGASPTAGWVYTQSTGTISANTTTEQDASGKAYNTY